MQSISILPRSTCEWKVSLLREMVRAELALQLLHLKGDAEPMFFTPLAAREYTFRMKERRKWMILVSTVQ